jgi:hypothetical protein
MKLHSNVITPANQVQLGLTLLLHCGMKSPDRFLFKKGEVDAYFYSFFAFINECELAGRIAAIWDDGVAQC